MKKEIILFLVFIVSLVYTLYVFTSVYNVTESQKGVLIFSVTFILFYVARVITLINL